MWRQYPPEVLRVWWNPTVESCLTFRRPEGSDFLLPDFGQKGVCDMYRTLKVLVPIFVLMVVVMAAGTADCLDPHFPWGRYNHRRQDSAIDKRRKTRRLRSQW